MLLISKASRKAGRVKALVYHSNEMPFGGKIAAGLGSIEVMITINCGSTSNAHPAHCQQARGERPSLGSSARVRCRRSCRASPYDRRATVNA